MKGQAKLKNKKEQTLSPLGVWAMALGCIIGWGAFAMPGTSFLPDAGPVGTIIGVVISCAMCLVVGANYSYLLQHYPDNGASHTYIGERIFFQISELVHNMHICPCTGFYPTGGCSRAGSPRALSCRTART